MEIVKNASAGTMESSDVYVEIEPGTAGVEVELESVVQLQFGDAIEAVVREVLCEQGGDPVEIARETVFPAVREALDRGGRDNISLVLAVDEEARAEEAAE